MHACVRACMYVCACVCVCVCVCATGGRGGGGGLSDRACSPGKRRVRPSLLAPRPDRDSHRACRPPGAARLLAPRQTPSVLLQVRAWLQEATIWHEAKHHRAYLGAYKHEGFAAPLLLQVGAEIKAAFPKIFCGHNLQQYWGPHPWPASARLWPASGPPPPALHAQRLLPCPTHEALRPARHSVQVRLHAGAWHQRPRRPGGTPRRAGGQCRYPLAAVPPPRRARPSPTCPPSLTSHHSHPTPFLALYLAAPCLAAADPRTVGTTCTRVTHTRACTRAHACPRPHASRRP